MTIKIINIIFILFLNVNGFNSQQIIEVPLHNNHFSTEFPFVIYFNNIYSGIQISTSMNDNYLTWMYIKSEPSFRGVTPIYGLKRNKIPHEAFSLLRYFEGPQSHILFNFKFITAITSEYDSKLNKNLIGLAYHIKSITDHIVTQLYEQRKIYKPSFALHVKDMKMYFGGIPSKSGAKFVTQGSLTYKNLNYYGLYMTLTSIIVGNSTVNLKEPIQLRPRIEEKDIVIPTPLYLAMQISNFEKFVDQGYCYKVGGKKPHPVYSGKDYMCNKIVVEHFYDIYFVIGGNKVKLKKEYLFLCKPNEKFCLFNVLHGKENHLLIGLSFWEMFIIEYHLDQNNPTFSIYDVPKENIQINPIDITQKDIEQANSKSKQNNTRNFFNKKIIIRFIRTNMKLLIFLILICLICLIIICKCCRKNKYPKKKGRNPIRKKSLLR